MGKGVEEKPVWAGDSGSDGLHVGELSPYVHELKSIGYSFRSFAVGWSDGPPFFNGTDGVGVYCDVPGWIDPVDPNLPSGVSNGSVVIGVRGSVSLTLSGGRPACGLGDYLPADLAAIPAPRLCLN
jgi:hypothetical protein